MKPIDFFAKIPANSGLHLVNIPYTKTFEDFYTLGEFTKRDYPSLLQGKDSIDTIAVPAVLAVYNWPKKTDRYRKVERFVQYLFNNWSKFQHPPFHPKWRDINLAATVPGWTRFSVAQDMLDRITSQQTSFQTFLSTNRKCRPATPTAKHCSATSCNGSKRREATSARALSVRSGS